MSTMMTKPIPPMTPEMWSKYWAASWGMKPGARYQLSFNNPKGMIKGKYKGITPSGELEFTADKKTYRVPLTENVTLKRRYFVQ